MTPSLSIVIPVYNEPEWIGRTVAAADRAVAASEFDSADILVVDDGSDPATRSALDRLSPRTEIRILRQATNSGRFAARRRGIEAARGELVLLLDARVLLAEDSLRFLGEHWTRDRAVWNGHCMINCEGNPYARFWETLTRAALPEYLANPRTTSFGIEEYDRFPKGTGHLAAPRQLLLEAIDEFRSHYSDTRFSSDDTHLLRSVARRQRINISPGFASLYHGRTTLRGFLRHAFHRGTSFVDSFARPGSRFLPVLLAVPPASTLALATALRRPRLAAVLALSVPAAAAVAGRRWRRPWPDVLAFAALVPPFGLTFVAGVWRGVLLLVYTRAKR